MERNDLVKSMIEEFESAGLEISHADYEGYVKPESIQGYTPDVIAWDSEKELYYLGTVADPTSLNPEEMENKIQTLSKLMMGRGNSIRTQIPYYVGVPKQKSTEFTKLINDKILHNDNVLTIEV